MVLNLNFACLGIFIALDAHSFARAFASAGIGARALTANRKSATVANATIAVDSLKAFEISLNLSAEITLNQDLIGIDRVDDCVDLLGAQIFSAGVRIDVRLLKNFFGVARPHSINVGKRGFDAFVAGYVYS